MYLLAYMLASKAKYFNNIDDYDGYAYHLAYATYSRMKDADKIKIKSVLNYMKSVMYFRKLSYQNESFAEIIDPVYNQAWNSDLYREKNISCIEASMSDNIGYFVKDIIKSIPQMIKDSIPNVYRNDKLLCHNLYLSSLLSLLSRSTLNKNNEDYLSKKLLNSTSFDEIKYYRKHLDENAVILWYVPETMVPVINIILNKVKAQFVQEVREIVSDFRVTEDMFQDMSKDLIFGDVTSED